VDYTAWMPTAMPPEEKQEHADAWPDDPHMAAAVAWESWAAQQQEDEATAATAGIRSISTGAQSVTYDGPRTASGRASARAVWHRARARAYSVDVGPTFQVGRSPWAGDDEEGTVIQTYPSPPIPPTQPWQVNVPPAGRRGLPGAL
jgi:hypothetical protein